MRESDEKTVTTRAASNSTTNSFIISSEVSYSSLSEKTFKRVDLFSAVDFRDGTGCDVVVFIGRRRRQRKLVLIGSVFLSQAYTSTLLTTPTFQIHDGQFCSSLDNKLRARSSFNSKLLLRARAATCSCPVAVAMNVSSVKKHLFRKKAFLVLSLLRLYACAHRQI